MPRCSARSFGLTGITLRDFHGDDGALVEELYSFLRALYTVADDVYQGREDSETLVAFLRTRRYCETLAPRFAQLGTGVERGELSLDVRQAYHDIRGGSYGALALLLSAAQDDEALPGEYERVYLLVRDHMKIMRSAVHDLDPVETAADQEILHHRIDLLQEKWSGTTYAVDGATAVIDYQSSFDGSIADCCIEFAALDRVLYNLINNATRFTRDGAVYIRIEPIVDGRPDDDGRGIGNVRFAVINRVSAEQANGLIARFGEDLGDLFAGGFTTGGHGIGLRICADLVVHGYRLSKIDHAYKTGLVGARLIHDTFVAWFHWPGRIALRSA